MGGVPLTQNIPICDCRHIPKTTKLDARRNIGRHIDPRPCNSEPRSRNSLQCSIVSSRCCSGTLYLVAVKSGTYLVA